MSGPKPGRPLSPLELLAVGRIKRVIAERLAESVGYVLGGMGCTLVVTIPDGPADEKTGYAPMSTYTYVVWTQNFNNLPREMQEELARAHHQSSLKGIEGQLDALEKTIAANAQVAAAMAESQAPAPEPPKEPES